MLEATPTSARTTRIRVLPDALVDQIAAGEVVERPASVVKELVENSLDAGARTIRVDVRDGGLALIAVEDDGCGMTPEELPLALSRHATSKLRTAADLERIASFGFRGEALPAIASVSRFRIVSRTRGAAVGHELLIDAGRVVHSRAAGGPEGTRIEVAELFAAVPARRKFLKRASTEWGHIADWLARLAMARPEIHLEIRRDGRPPTIWPACTDRRDRLALLLPEEDGASLVAVDHTTAEVRVHGFVSSPEHSRATGQGISLFVNGRPVRDRMLSHAIGEPFRDLLPRGRYPVAVLFIEVPPQGVDVNVHPAKWEVRFSDPQSVHRAIRHAVRAAIGSRRWLAPSAASGAAPGVETAAAAGPDAVHRFRAEQRMSPPPTPGQSPSSEVARRLPFETPFETPVERPLETRAATELRAGWTQRPLATAGSPPSDWSLARDAASAETSWPPGLRDEATDPTGAPTLLERGERAEARAMGGLERPALAFGALRLLGQLQASYLLAEGEQGLIVVDQHAAHERILYERLRASWLEAGVARQGLLTPLVVQVAPAAVAAVEASAEAIDRLGFDLEPFGDDAVVLRALPAELVGSDPAALVHELVAVIAELEPGGEVEGSAVRWLARLDRVFATMACHAARRFGDRLPEAEQRAILAGLDTIPWAPTCPHGRPVAILLETTDLEARFRRR